MKKSAYLVALLGVLTFSLSYQIVIYESWVPILLWSNSTLYLNVIANRQGWRACKRFRWCDGNHPIPKWEIRWRGETRFRV
jgi:hypothetical protein